MQGAVFSNSEKALTDSAEEKNNSNNFDLATVITVIGAPERNNSV